MTKNKYSVFYGGIICLFLTFLVRIQAFNIETKIIDSTTQIYTISDSQSPAFAADTMAYDKDNNKMLVGSLNTGNVHSCDLSNGVCSPITFSNGNAKGLTSLVISNGGEVTACYSLDETRCKDNKDKELLGQLGHCFKSADGNSNFQQLEEQNCGTPANVYLMFMIDGSGSVNSTEFTKIKEWINGISKKANLDKTTFGVIQFASKEKTKVEIEFGAYSDLADFNSKVEALVQAEGRTYTAKGLGLAADAIAALNTEEDLFWLFVLTDGISSQSNKELQEQINRLKNINVNRATVGVGADINRNQLIDIASSEQDVYEIVNFDALIKVEDALVVKLEALGNEGTKNQSTELRSLHKGFSSFFDQVSLKNT